jgi:pilus assembly protein CpaF
MVERFDLAALETLPKPTLQQEIAAMTERLLAEDSAASTIWNEAADPRHPARDAGLRPLELLMADPAVSDILVNRHDQIYVERLGRLELTPVVFTDEKHLLRIIDKIVSRIGRRIDESSPMVDARLPDGSRVNAVIPPVALDGPMMSIRRFARIPLRMENLIQDLKSLTPNMALVLEAWPRPR